MNIIKHFTSCISALFVLALSTQAAFAALVDMAEYQDWEGVESSISSGDINAVQPDGMTALLWATYYDETDVARLLLNAGANPNIENRYGMVPLIQAGMNGNSEIITMLLDAGADPNKTTPEGDNALLNASKTGAVEGVQALIDAGANVNSRDSYLFQTPLMWAASTNQAEVVKILIESGADMNTRSASLELRGVRQGAVAGDFPDGGLTALHHAARENAIDAAQVLLEKGADLDIPDPQGISALRFAVINANIDLARMLIEGGADFNDGALVDLLDVETKDLIFTRAEKNYDNQTTPLELISLMLDMGIDIDSYPAKAYPFPATGFRGGQGTAGQTALYNTAVLGNQELMALFLDHGANPNSLNKGDKYFPLSAALSVVPGRPSAMMGEEEDIPSIDDLLPAAELLIEHGADINTPAKDGATVLHHAAAMGRDEVIEFLIAQGADLAAKDHSNRTALDIASGISSVTDEGESDELPIYESTVTLLTEAMNNQGISIEDYVAPVAEDASDEA